MLSSRCRWWFLRPASGRWRNITQLCPWCLLKLLTEKRSEQFFSFTGYLFIYLFIYLLFSFFSLLLMWSAFDWMLSRKGTFVHIISSLNWKIQLFIMQWYTVLIQSNLSNMKNSHLDLNWINQMSILNIIHSSCCRHWVKLFRRRRWLSPEWMSEYPTQR